MKTILILGMAFLTGTAFAQSGGSTAPLAEKGNRHMFEFNADSIWSAAFALDRSKVKGSSADSDTRANLSFNYAYGIHRFVQGGVRFKYSNGINGSIDQELMDISFGAIFNSQSDFTKSYFTSVYLGAGFAQDFGNGTRDDIRHGTISVGRRIPLEALGIKNVTYTPELAFRMASSTTSESFDYQQSLEFRILQFSIFF